MTIWSTLWDAMWWFLKAFVFVAYLIALFSIISDLFRDRNLGGVAKAIWLIFLMFLPFATAVLYLIVRGRGMGERSVSQAQTARAATEDYIRSVSGGKAAEIAQAKSLLDTGAITEDEYAQLKAQALQATG